jgi:hypothetical protein
LREGRKNGTPIRTRQSVKIVDGVVEIKSPKTAETPRQLNNQIIALKKTVPELRNVPSTSFVPGTTGGIFNVGFIAPRVEIPQDYPATSTTVKNFPLFVSPSVSDYFFIQYNNPGIAASVEGIVKSFAVIKTLSSVTVKDCSEMLRLHYTNVIAITKNQYDNDSFSHPKYLNDSNLPLSIRYAEIPIIKQKTPGRLDDIPLGYPDFDSTPDGITTRVGPVPTAPYTDFSYVGSTAAYISAPGATSSGSTIYVTTTTKLVVGMYISIGMQGIGSLSPDTRVISINSIKQFTVSPSPIVPLSGTNNVITGILPARIIPGGTVSFIDTSVANPWQFAPTGWVWNFGPSASPTGSTIRNPIVAYGTTGSYTVTLTASNANGSTSKTKTNFVTVTY